MEWFRIYSTSIYTIIWSQLLCFKEIFHSFQPSWSQMINQAFVRFSNLGFWNPLIHYEWREFSKDFTLTTLLQMMACNVLRKSGLMADAFEMIIWRPDEPEFDPQWKQGRIFRKKFSFMCAGYTATATRLLLESNGGHYFLKLQFSPHTRHILNFIFQSAVLWNALDKNFVSLFRDRRPPRGYRSYDQGERLWISSVYSKRRS